MIRITTVIATLFLGICARHALAVPDGSKLGPYPSGVTTTIFVDVRRTDHFTGRPRTLVTEIWYPAGERARKLPRSKFSDFLPPGADAATLSRLAWGRSADELNRLYTMTSVRNAPVRAGRFPLVVFSHGNGGSRYQNTFWCDFLASHGYIVVSADHTGNAAVTILPGTVVPYQSGERAASAVDRPRDMSFLLDEMTRWNRGGDRRFTGRIDLRRPCAAGMSFGSMSAVAVADADPRFTSVIAMSGAYPQHRNQKVPTLWMIGTEDRTIGAAGNDIVRAHHAKHEGPSYLLELKNGGHYSFTDMPRLKPDFGDGTGHGVRRNGGAAFEFTSMATTYEIVNSYSLAFLNAYARGDRSALPAMRRNGWPAELIWDARNTGG